MARLSPRRAGRGKLNGVRGSVSVEAVLVMPVFFAAVFGIMEASLWVYASTVAQAAAQDGVRAATVYRGSTLQGVHTAETILATRDCGRDWVVTTSAGGTVLTFTVTGRAPSVVPGLGLTVRQSASLPWEVR